MSETTKGYEPLIDCTQPTPHRLAALGGLVCSAGLWGARLTELVPDEGVWSHAPHLGFGVAGMGLAAEYLAKRKPSIDASIIGSGLLATQIINCAAELAQSSMFGSDEYGPAELITTNLPETAADALYATLGCIATALVMTGKGVVSRYRRQTT